MANDFESHTGAETAAHSDIAENDIISKDTKDSVMNNILEDDDGSGNDNQDSQSHKDVLNLHSKTIMVFSMMFILFIPISIILFFSGQYFSHQSELEQDQMKLEVLNNIVVHIDDMSMAAQKQFDKNLSTELELMVSILKEEVSEGVYTGPELFPDGFVVTLDGDNVIIPDGVPEGKMKITADMINTSLSSGSVRSGRFVSADSGGNTDKNADDDDDSAFTVTSYDAENNLDAAYDVSSLKGVYYLSFAQVAKNVIYVQMTPAQDFSNYLQLYTADSFAALKDISDLSDCMIAILANDGENFEILDVYSQLDGLDEDRLNEISSHKFTNNTISDMEIGGQSYRYICTQTDGRWIGKEAVSVIQFYIPFSTNSQMALQSSIVCLLMLVIFITLIVYALAEQRYVTENIMTTDQAKRYNPVRLHRKVISAGIVGAFAIFFFAFMTQAVSQLQQQIRIGKDTLQLLSGTLEQSVEKEQEDIRHAQEQWYVRAGQIMSNSFSYNTGLATPEKLSEFNDILNSDFIMLFDSAGNEIMSSNDYIDFKLDYGFGTNSSDFRQLLLGVSSIVHDVSKDSFSDEGRQFLGVTMDALDNPEKHGALMISLMPDQTNVAQNLTNAGAEMAMTLTKYTLCFNVKEATGEILNSSDPDMEGKTILDYGLDDSSLQDSYMDFGTINGIRRFIITSRIGNSIFYYATDNSAAIRENLLFSLISVSLFILALIIIIFVLLKEYNKESYKKLAVILMPGISLRKKKNDQTDMMDELVEDDSYKHNVIRSKAEFLSNAVVQKTSAFLNNTVVPKSSSILHSKAAKKTIGFIDYIKKGFKWDTRLPEEKSNLVFYIGLFFLLQLWILFMLIRNRGVSMVEYLLYGDWTRGINVFSLYCILIFTALANLVITISSWVLHLTASFLTARGETICNLLRSIIKYISILVVIFMSLSYIGVLTSTVIASVGVGSLIISLGSKDIVADILCGILMVFEQTMKIGDIVMYEDKYCIVLEVGMRTTKLEIQPGKDIFEVRNHEIVSVINMSINATTAVMTLRVRASEPLDKLEEIIKAELPELKKKCPQIIGTPSYFGVTKLGSDERGLIPMMTLAVGAKCNQKDYYAILNIMNREFHLLFEENGIGLY